MPPPRPACLLVAEAASALHSLCGVTMIERLLRMLQRLGFREATVLSSTLAPLRAELERPSWARAEVQLHFSERAAGPLRVAELQDYCSLGHGRALLLPGDFYFDARLLAALAQAERGAVLIDSAASDPQTSGAALVDCDWLMATDGTRLISSALTELPPLDAAKIDTYLRDQRNHVRPVFFPAPSADGQRTAERVIQRSAQKGTLDLPAMVHAPIENWLVSKIWRTRIRPNHLSALTLCVGIVVTILYARGHLLAGVLVALAVGVLDGLDGKLARTKIETTPLGRWEHEADYFVETSWWLALAWHFAQTSLGSLAWWLIGALLLLDLLDRVARGWVKRRLDRNLDDVAPFDRFVRLIGARRNIYTWILAIGFFCGARAGAFVFLCAWGMATAAVHLLRAGQIRWTTR